MQPLTGLGLAARSPGDDGADRRVQRTESGPAEAGEEPHGSGWRKGGDRRTPAVVERWVAMG